MRGRAGGILPGPAVKLTTEFDRQPGRDRDPYTSNHEAHPKNECHAHSPPFRSRIGSPGWSWAFPSKLPGTLRQEPAVPIPLQKRPADRKLPSKLLSALDDQKSHGFSRHLVQHVDEFMAGI